MNIRVHRKFSLPIGLHVPISHHFNPVLVERFFDHEVALVGVLVGHRVLGIVQGGQLPVDATEHNNRIFINAGAR